MNTPTIQTVTKVETFGDARKLVLETILDLKRGTISVDRGMAIAANMKVLNDNIQAEINATKVTMLAIEKGYDFGKVVKMGQKLIGE